MKISFCITVCNESEELKRLLKIIYQNKRDMDEVVVQGDSGKVTKDVTSVLYQYIGKGLIYIEYPLRDDFATYKNNLYNNCTGDWAFFIDADEYPHENLIKCLPELIDSAEYEGIELIRVPRVNTVLGITNEHLRRWNWRIHRINDLDVINWPDRQNRLIRKKDGIHWKNKVHEVFTGYSAYTDLPADIEWSLFHPKTIEKQMKQNSYYETIG